MTTLPTPPPKDPHLASSWPIPDDTLTPGAVDAGCMPSRPQSERSVPESEKNAIAAAYHYTGPRGIAYLEFDHRVPFALCGSNGPENVWPEVIDDAPLSLYVHNRKDQLEAKIFSLIRYNHMTFAQGQVIFIQHNDWPHQWCVYVHKAGDGVTCDV